MKGNVEIEVILPNVWANSTYLRMYMQQGTYKLVFRLVQASHVHMCAHALMSDSSLLPSIHLLNISTLANKTIPRRY